MPESGFSSITLYHSHNYLEGTHCHHPHFTDRKLRLRDQTAQKQQGGNLDVGLPFAGAHSINQYAFPPPFKLLA